MTAASDFAMLLALRRATSPSVVHLRQVSELSPDDHAELLAANLGTIEEELTRGAIASLGPPASQSETCRSAELSEALGRVGPTHGEGPAPRGAGPLNWSG